MWNTQKGTIKFKVTCEASPVQLDWNHKEEDVIGYVLESNQLKVVNLATQKITTVIDPTKKKGQSVTCFKWHPSKANVLAYGTREGGVGFFDTATSKNTKIKEKQKAAVEDLEWFQGEEYILVAYMDRTMKVYDYENPDLSQIKFDCGN